MFSLYAIECHNLSEKYAGLETGVPRIKITLVDDGLERISYEAMFSLFAALWRKTSCMLLKFWVRSRGKDLVVELDRSHLLK